MTNGDPPPLPSRSYFLLGWNHARAFPKTISATHAADRWSHNRPWPHRFAREWWIDGFNSFRAVLEDQSEANTKGNKPTKGKKP
jgi:hypothetical protein